MGNPANKYVWFSRGREFIIVKNPTADNLNYDDPDETITGGLLLEYSAVPDVVDINEEDWETYNIKHPDIIQDALILYIKAKLAEDKEDLKKKEYYLQEFRRLVGAADEARIGGLKQLQTVRGYAIR